MPIARSMPPSSGRNGWVGIEIAKAEGPAEFATGFRADPAAAVAGGKVRVAGSAGLGELRVGLIREGTGSEAVGTNRGFFGGPDAP